MRAEDAMNKEGTTVFEHLFRPLQLAASAEEVCEIAARYSRTLGLSAGIYLIRGCDADLMVEDALFPSRFAIKDCFALSRLRTHHSSTDQFLPRCPHAS